MTHRTVEVRDASRAELLALEGLADVEFTLRGRVALIGGEIVGWLGVAEGNGDAFAFSGIRPGFRWPMLGIREAKAMLATLPHAWCVAKSERSARLLRRLGWRHAGSIDGEEVFEWS